MGFSCCSHPACFPCPYYSLALTVFLALLCIAGPKRRNGSGYGGLVLAGHSPSIAGGYIVKRAASLGLFVAATIRAFTSYTTEPTWRNIGALAVLAATGASFVCRWLVRRIVEWAQTDTAVSTAQLVRNHPAARAITQLETLTKIVSAPVLSITLARDAARRCYSDGGLFDQIVMPYLDRADAAGELVWSAHDSPYQFDEYGDQGDLDTIESPPG